MSVLAGSNENYKNKKISLTPYKPTEIDFSGITILNRLDEEKTLNKRSFNVKTLKYCGINFRGNL